MTAQRLARQERIGAYKRVLRDCIDQRPSGMRQKIAQVLGTHKSFISQITNPADSTPIPARHVEPIIDVCHLSPSEKQRFLDAYNAAHDRRLAVPEEGRRHYKTLRIQVPVLHDAEQQELLEALIRDLVGRISRLLGPR